VVKNSDQEPYAFAQLYARMGERDEAFKFLNKAYERHDELVYLLFDEFWDRWRNEPEFKAVVGKVGLRDYQKLGLERLSRPLPLE